MTDDENFFLHCVEDLRSKVKDGTRYNLLRSMGICRQLLLDEHPLVHLVNRNFRVPILFRHESVLSSLSVLPNELTEHLAMTYVGNPRLIPEKNRSPAVKLDAFLKLPIAYFLGRFITVQQIILTSSNCFGGVHRAPPKDEEQRAIAEFDMQISIFGVPFSSDAAGNLTNTIIEALEPLERAIKSKGWHGT